MSEILDPIIMSGFLTSDKIFSIAESLAQNTRLQEDLGQEKLDTILDEEMPNEQLGEIDREYSKKFLALMGLSCISVYPIMQDQLGRSENHIAGEVCRVVKALRSLIIMEDIAELKYFYNLTSRPTYHHVFWVPDGTTTPCPTIDEQKYTEARTVTPSVHEEWLQVFKNRALPDLAFNNKSMLEPIRIPFVLNTGGVVTSVSPVFYRLTRDETIAEVPKPKILVSA